MQDAEACFMIADRCFKDRTAAVRNTKKDICWTVFSLSENNAYHMEREILTVTGQY